MKIAIIGGSIAGCALALLLKDICEVVVFEQKHDLQSRGAGITISIELLHLLMDKNILDEETLAHHWTGRSFYCQSPDNLLFGTFLWQQNAAMASLHWDTLFTNLRKRIPNQMYHHDCKVVDVLLQGTTNKVILASGETHHFDFVVFADGAQSIGRKLISPQASSKLEYSGYVAWRGTLDFDQIKNKSHFNSQGLYYCFNKGHLLTYPIYHHQVHKLNWVFYEKLALEKLELLGSTSLINFSNNAKQHLYQLAHKNLPQIAAQIIRDTPSPFMQKIVDVCANQFITQGALLLGDASTVLRPHVGNGSSLAVQDALSLYEYFLQSNNFQQAMVSWEKDSLPKRVSMYDLSKRMANALVLNPVDWQEMNESKMPSWWEKIILGDQWYTTISQDKK